MGQWFRCKAIIVLYFYFFNSFLDLSKYTLLTLISQKSMVMPPTSVELRYFVLSVSCIRTFRYCPETRITCPDLCTFL